MTVLVIAEHHNNKVSSATLSAISAAQHWQEPVDILVLGENLESIVKDLCKRQGLARVLSAENPLFQDGIAECLAPPIAQLAEQYDVVLAGASSFGKNLMPRVAAMLNLMQFSDVSAIIDHHTFERPIYAGNAIERVKSFESKQILTIRPTAFAPAPHGNSAAECQTLSLEPGHTGTTLLSRSESSSDRPELTAAEVVVSGGRGLQNKENFALIEQLADVLNAAVGASRAAVDAGFVPNDYQVGQTGKIVAPKLYIAVGISGAIQHIAGMKDAKTIVAINKDPDAPIFQVASYGLVGDLFDIVPELTRLIQEQKGV